MLRSGAKLTGISYRSGGESVTAVLSKAVAVTFENVAILAPLIRDGKVRALAVANKTRTPLLPDVPTLAEAGVLDAEANTFLVPDAASTVTWCDSLSCSPCINAHR